MQVMVILHTQALFSGSGHTMYGPSPEVKEQALLQLCNASNRISSPKTTGLVEISLFCMA